MLLFISISIRIKVKFLWVCLFWSPGDENHCFVQTRQRTFYHQASFQLQLWFYCLIFVIWDIIPTTLWMSGMCYIMENPAWPKRNIWGGFRMFEQKSRVQTLAGPRAYSHEGCGKWAEPAICPSKADSLGCILRAVNISDICTLGKESKLQNLDTEWTMHAWRQSRGKVLVQGLELAHFLYPSAYCS